MPIFCFRCLLYSRMEQLGEISTSPLWGSFCWKMSRYSSFKSSSFMCPAGKSVGNAFSKKMQLLCVIYLYFSFTWEKKAFIVCLKWFICLSVLSNGACTCVCGVCMCRSVWVCIYVCVSMCVVCLCMCEGDGGVIYVCVCGVCLCRFEYGGEVLVYGVCMCGVCVCTCVYMYVWVRVVFGSVCHISMCVCLCVLCGLCVLVCIVWCVYVFVLYVVSWENKRANAFVMRL